jgi:acyl-CoA thioesterase I
MPDAPAVRASLVDFRYPLPNLAESLKARRNIKIVAIGSSSTAGESDVLSYPPRLEMLLRENFAGGESFPGRMIDVLNRGIGGEEAPAELSRFDADVFAENPVLVIWQVGTNAVYRSEEFSFDDVMAKIVTGLLRLADRPIDVVIMDSQYTPAVVDGPKLKMSEELVGRIADAAREAGVNVFRRFALMRQWAEHGVPMEELFRQGDERKLHMSEWSTNCATRALFQSIKRAVAA